MKLIIPMAGKGTRLRPHTLFTPKPLMSLAGQSLVERLVDQLVLSFKEEKITDIGFVIGDWEDNHREILIALAQKYQAKSHFFVQKNALGTADAVFCAAELLQDKVLIAFADTLLEGIEPILPEQKAAILVKTIDNPSAFGVIDTDQTGKITGFVEKPKDRTIAQAMIGVYYFAQGEKLKAALQQVIEQKIMNAGEYQLPTAFGILLKNGMEIFPITVQKWLDCGNKTAFLEANRDILKTGAYQEKKYKATHSLVIPPCFIGEDVEIENSIIGPFVCIEKGAQIKNSILDESWVGKGAQVMNVVLSSSMVGSYAKYQKQKHGINLGPHSVDLEF